jgi:hypothetical protein
VAFELVTGSWSAGTAVTLVGFEPDSVPVPGPARVGSAADLGDALAAVEPAARRAGLRLGQLDAANMATGRLADAAPLRPHVLLLAEPPADADIDRVTRLAGDAHSPVVIACVGDCAYARWQFTATPDGRLDLGPLGLRVRPLTAAVEAHQRQLATATTASRATPAPAVALVGLPAAPDPTGLPAPAVQPAGDPSASAGVSGAAAPAGVGDASAAVPAWLARAGEPVAPAAVPAWPAGAGVPAAPAGGGASAGVPAWPAGGGEPGEPAAVPGASGAVLPATARTAAALPTASVGPAAAAAPAAVPAPGRGAPVGVAGATVAVGPPPVAGGGVLGGERGVAAVPGARAEVLTGRAVGVRAVVPTATAPGAVGTTAHGWRGAIAGLARPVLDVEGRDRLWPAVVEVRVLGPVEVRAPGAVAQGYRGVLAELAAAAAVHPDGLPEWAVRERFADAAVGAGLLAGWVGTDAQGRSRLRERPGGWALDGARVDWQLFRELVAAPEPGNERERLVTALGLVRGPAPTAPAESYLGQALRRGTEQLPAIVTATARRAAELAWQSGDAGNAEWSLRQGITLLPAAQPIWRLLLSLRAVHDPGSLPELAAEMLGTLGQDGPTRLEPETSTLLARLAPAAAL